MQVEMRPKSIEYHPNARTKTKTKPKAKTKKTNQLPINGANIANKSTQTSIVSIISSLIARTIPL